MVTQARSTRRLREPSEGCRLQPLGGAAPAPDLALLVKNVRQRRRFEPGRCSKGVDPVLDCDTKLIPIDEEADHQIMHSRRFGKAPIRRLLSRGNTSPLRNF